VTGHNDMSTEQSKYWVFTLNNYNDADQSGLRELWRLGRVAYLCYGREVGSNQGVPHLQGMVEFSRKMRRTGVSKLVPRAFIEARRGTATEARTYCIKDGDFEEHGVQSQPQQGKRSDLDGIFEEIKDGRSELEIAESNPRIWCQYGRRFERYRELLRDEPRTWVTEIFIITGITGVGKSRYVHSKESDLYVSVDNSGAWFDGYAGHNAVLFDDFEGDTKLSSFLRLCDRYPMRVPVKGGFVNWKPKRIYFTSNIHHTGWWSGCSTQQRDAWRRRITGEACLTEDLDFDKEIDTLINWI